MRSVFGVRIRVGRGGFLGGFLFAFHVFVLDGVEDIAAGLALDVLGVFVPGDDANDSVFARRKHGRG